MTAAVLYGSENLKIESVDIPELAADEALIRVKVALTCGTDLESLEARIPRAHDHAAGGVRARTCRRRRETWAPDVNGGLKVGARVVPSNSAPCNVCLFCRKGQSNLCEDLLFNNGAYAEYIRIPGRIVRQNMLVIPEHVSFQDAAMVEPLACVLRGIDETGIQPGDTTVVIGCGPIGLEIHSHAVRPRRERDRARQARRTRFARPESLGARAAFDRSGPDRPVRKSVRELTEGGRGADSVIEAVGTAQTWEWALQMVRRGGTVNLFGGCPRGTQSRSRPERAALFGDHHQVHVPSHAAVHPGSARQPSSRGEIRSQRFRERGNSAYRSSEMFEHMKHRNGEMKVAVIP